MAEVSSKLDRPEHDLQLFRRERIQHAYQHVYRGISKCLW